MLRRRLHQDQKREVFYEQLLSWSFKRGAIAQPYLLVKKIPIRAIFNAMAESFVAKKKRAGVMYRVLSKSYPDVECELDFNNPLQLLIATVLSPMHR